MNGIAGSRRVGLESWWQLLVTAFVVYQVIRGVMYYMGSVEVVSDTAFRRRDTGCLLHHKYPEYVLILGWLRFALFTLLFGHDNFSPVFWHG